MKEQCSLCWYYKSFADYGEDQPKDSGFCRFNPPEIPTTQTGNYAKLGESLRRYHTFPGVFADDWCGKFCPREAFEEGRTPRHHA